MINQFLAFLGYALSGSLTPGPNNMMLLSSGANFGFRRTIPHILGIIVGFMSLVLLSGLGLGGLIAADPRIQLALKLGGGAYMLYLAWKIANSHKKIQAQGDEKADAKPMTFMQAALFQWVNPKAWVICVSGLSMFLNADNPMTSLLWAMLAYFLASIAGTCLWAGCGTGLKTWLQTGKRLAYFNITMGLLLALSVIYILTSGQH